MIAMKTFGASALKELQKRFGCNSSFVVVTAKQLLPRE
jgi:hypothetical protein